MAIKISYAAGRFVARHPIWSSVLAVLVLGLLVRTCSTETPAPRAASTVPTAAAAPSSPQQTEGPDLVGPPATLNFIPSSSATEPTVAATGSPWHYSEGVDRMQGSPTQMAVLQSQNSLAFDFPYSGSNYGMLVVRSRGKGALDVLLKIEKGQIICHSDDCPVYVKIDDAKPIYFTGTEPSDRSNQTVFLSNELKFVAGARKATRILVQFNAYHNGSPVLEFKAREALLWPPKLGLAR